MPEHQRASIPPARILRRQAVLEEHDPLPGGGGAVVVRRFVHAETYRSHLYLVDFRPSRPPLPLTTGTVRDTSPRVSPDGRRLAFLRSFPDQPDRPTAVMVAALDGGEPWTLWVPEHGVTELAWSPDGSRLALVAAGATARSIIGPEAKGRAVTARRITRADWRSDEVGHRDRWNQAWVIAARRGARPRQLTHGEADVKGIAWAPDGRSIAYAGDPRPDADIRPRPSIWVVPAAGGEPREAIRLAGYAGSPAFSPDGRWLACIGVDVADPIDDEQPGLFLAPAARGAGVDAYASVGSGTVAGTDRGGADPDAAAPPPATALAPNLDRPIGAFNDTDLNGWMASARPGPCWDGPSSLVALVSEAGRVRPWRFPVDPATGRPAEAPQRLVDGDIAAWTLGVAGGVVSVVATVDDRPMELLTLERGNSRAALRARTSLGGAWRRRLPWPEMRRVLAPGAGGPIETWIASPAGAGEAALPTVVNIHGGPLGGWSPAPSTENVLLAAHGYRVILPNIRGSAGYGRAWIRPQLGNWGGVDAADVLAVVDHVVGLGIADPGRLGVLGLSYGGFLVNWLVGATPGRFAAAVSENGVSNQLNDWANSDSGPEYDRMALLGDPFSEEGVAKLWRQSPLRLVARIQTPLLMLQGEADLRCPAADNEQLFVALRHLGREVEYVLYPESWHTFAITGRIDRRIDRNERVLAWFDRFLKR
jgi:dipeptidyl aminopeptidase/acylaminoacyl peptidase